LENKKCLYPMEVCCAWCKLHMYWTSSCFPDQVSHGICEECKKGVVEELRIIRRTDTFKEA